MEAHDPLTAAPFRSRVMQVDPAWIDYNGHMNLAFYHVLFDRCCDEVVPLLGCGPDYRRATNHTIFAGQAHVQYLRELNLGDSATATFRLVAYGAKRAHVALELYHVDGWKSATSEILWLHIDQSGPRIAPFPQDVLAKLDRMHRAHRALPPLDWVGQGLRFKP